MRVTFFALEVQMLRLMKFAAYALFAFFLFEAFRGIAAPRPNRAPMAPRPQKGRMKTVPVWDESGVQRTQKVGRGVVS